MESIEAQNTVLFTSWFSMAESISTCLAFRLAAVWRIGVKQNSVLSNASPSIPFILSRDPGVNLTSIICESFTRLQLVSRGYKRLFRVSGLVF
jgi:hypothetical protein